MLTSHDKLQAELAAENQIHREMVEQLASGDYDLDQYCRLIGIDPQKIHRAIKRASPVSYGQMRACIAGFIEAFGSTSFGEREISIIAQLAYDALPWRRAA